MPKGSKILGQPINEEKWERAKALAAEAGHSEDYAYIMGIYKQMRKSCAKTKQLKTATATEKSSIDRPSESGYTEDRGFKLILAKGGLDEFRCGDCGALLFKGMHLQKSFIEVKCRRCGALNINAS